MQARSHNWLHSCRNGCQDSQPLRREHKPGLFTKVHECQMSSHSFGTSAVGGINARGLTGTIIVWMFLQYLPVLAQRKWGRARLFIGTETFKKMTELGLLIISASCQLHGYQLYGVVYCPEWKEDSESILELFYYYYYYHHHHHHHNLLYVRYLYLYSWHKLCP